MLVGTAFIHRSSSEDLSPLVWVTVFVPWLPTACLEYRVVAEGHGSLSMVCCTHLSVAGSYGWTVLSI